MPELNPYEAPQENSQLPLAELLSQSQRRRKLVIQAKPPAFWLAVILQVSCLVAVFLCLMFSGSTYRQGTPNDILAIAAIMLAFAGLMGVGILIIAKRYELQGWSVLETVLLMLIIFVFAASR